MLHALIPIVAIALAPPMQVSDAEVEAAARAFMSEYVMFLAEHNGIVDLDETPMIERAEAAFADVPIDALSTDQIAYLVNEEDIASHLTRETVSAMFHRLRTIAADEDRAGIERAEALAFGAWMPLDSYRHGTQGSDADLALQRAMHEEFASHPQRYDVLGTERTSQALYLLMAPFDEGRPVASADFGVLLDRLDGETAHAEGAAGMLWHWTLDYHGRDKDPITDAMRERARVLAIRWFERQAASYRERDPRYADAILESARALETRAARGTLIDGPAPALDVLWCDDPAFEGIDALRGKVVVLDFWATWCTPCIESFGHMRTLRERYDRDDVAIIGVTSLQGRVYNLADSGTIDAESPDDEIRLLKKFAEQHDITWTSVVLEGDRHAVFQTEYGARGIPHLTIIDRAGRVRHNDLHPMDEDIEEKIDALLGDEP